MELTKEEIKKGYVSVYAKKTYGFNMPGKLADLIDAFGHDLGCRIFACASIVEKPKKWSEEDWTEENKIRLTIAKIKRIRRGYAESVGKIMTWAEGVERLEFEQVEGRHYKINFNKKTRAEKYDDEKPVDMGAVEKVAVSVVVQTEAYADYYKDFAERVTGARDWVHGLLDSYTMRQRVYIMGVVAGVRRGAELTRAQQQAIANRYSKGVVKPTDFVELFVRYA